MKIPSIVLKTKIFLMLLVLLCMSLTSLKIYAVETGTLGGYPTTYDSTNPNTRSWFIYNLGLSTTKTDSVTVVNNSDNNITAKVYAVDATTTSDGAFALLGQNEEKKDVGSWIKLSQSIVTLKAKEKKEISFSITIPQYTTVGDHAGGIIFEDNTPKPQNNSGINVNLISRIGIRIYETVPGEQNPQLSIQNFNVDKSGDKLNFKFSLQNTGNVFLYPKGNLNVKDQFGNVLQTLDLNNLESITPGKITEFSIPTNIQRPLLSFITADLNIKFGSNKSINSQLQFKYYNQTLIIILGVGLLLLLILVVFFIRKFLKRNKHPKTITESSKEK